MRCKVGDLAVIVAALPETECNLGAIVEVLAPAYFPEGKDFSWLVRATGRPLLGFGHFGLVPVNEIGIYDSSLRPLPGDTLDESTPERIKETA